MVLIPPHLAFPGDPNPVLTWDVSKLNSQPRPVGISSSRGRGAAQAVC